MRAIDLEHFPTNETALRMMERISPIYDRSYVGKWIFEIMGMEMGEARAYFEELRQQPFPERTTWAIGYWERRYAITPKPTDNLTTRRQNIIMKRGVRLPMNPTRMEEIINSLAGGSSTITENVEDYTFAVDIDGVSPGADVLRVLKEIKKRKPSHQTFMLFMSAPPIDYKLRLLATSGRISVTRLPEWRLTHNFRKAKVGFAAAAGRISTTALPQWRIAYDFQAEVKTAGELGVISTVTLPPAE